MIIYIKNLPFEKKKKNLPFGQSSVREVHLSSFQHQLKWLEGGWKMAGKLLLAIVYKLSQCQGSGSSVPVHMVSLCEPPYNLLGLPCNMVAGFQVSKKTGSRSCHFLRPEQESGIALQNPVGGISKEFGG